MLYNRLSSRTKRRVIGCNYNQHICSPHSDRVLDRHDLIYIREGEWLIAQDGIEYSICTGDVLLLQGGHHHYGTAPCSGTVKTIYIEFSVCDDDAVTEEAVCAENTETDAYSFPVVVHCQNAPNVRRLLENAVASFWSQNRAEQRKTPAWLDLLLCELSAVDSREDPLAENIKQVIQKTPGRFVSNTELAEQLHFSVRTLSSRFKAATGSSIHAWQIALKCQMADELLRREPQITLKEIAANYGFHDEYHFGKCYKKAFGRSPKSKK